MGAQFGAKCLPSQADAAAAYFTQFAPQVVSGGTSYVTEFQLQGGVWKSLGYQLGSGGAWTLRYTTNAAVPTFPACDESASFKDGAVVGWGIASAVVLAACLTMLKRGR